MLWGVTPLFTGDASSVGGLTRESAQTAMHDNLIESYQAVINQHVLPHMLKQMGVTDWEIGLVPPKESSEEIELAVEKQRIENAMQMMQLGYEPIKEKGKEIRFKYKKAEQQPGMPMPGQPGAEDGPPSAAGVPQNPAMAQAMAGGQQQGQPADVDQLPAPPPIAGPNVSESGEVLEEDEE